MIVLTMLKCILTYFFHWNYSNAKGYSKLRIQDHFNFFDGYLY